MKQIDVCGRLSNALEKSKTITFVGFLLLRDFAQSLKQDNSCVTVEQPFFMYANCFGLNSITLASPQKSIILRLTISSASLLPLSIEK